MAGKISQVYATALFELASESDKLSVFNEELLALKSVFSQNPDFIKLLSAPTMSDSQKYDMLSKAFEGKVEKDIYNFLRLLCDNGRIDSFIAIAEDFAQMYNEHMNILEVTAITSIPMSQGLKQKLIAKLEQVSSKKITLIEKVDKSIMGGIVLSYNNTRIDSSVATKLEKMKSQINSIIA